MKILDVICSLNPADGGPQHTVRAMSRVWRSMGHQVDIATLDAPDAPYLESDLMVHALGKLGSPTPRRGMSATLDRYGYAPGAEKKLQEIVRNYDVVLVHGLWNYSTFLARRVLVRGKTPYFVFVHGMLDPWHKQAYPLKDRIKQILWPFNEGKLVAHARAAFFTTQPEIDLADRSYFPYKLNPQLVGYGCQGPDSDAAASIAAFHDAFPRLRDRRFLLFLSRIHPKKGCDTLLKAFAAALPELGDMDLVMAGPDQTAWQTDLEALATALGIAGRVHWVGSIAGPVKWGAYRAADAFVLPSHGENFGIVVAEAMACGTPVIISDRVNLFQAVLDHKAGLVATHDLAGTIGALRQFAALTADERACMSQAGRECYETHYKLEPAAQRILETIEHFIGTGHVPAR